MKLANARLVRGAAVEVGEAAAGDMAAVVDMVVAAAAEVTAAEAADGRHGTNH